MPCLPRLGLSSSTGGGRKCDVRLSLKMVRVGCSLVMKSSCTQAIRASPAVKGAWRLAERFTHRACVSLVGATFVCD